MFVSYACATVNPSKALQLGRGVWFSYGHPYLVASSMLYPRDAGLFLCLKDAFVEYGIY
ncbi:MAG: hypothetical protein F6K24_25015 [Okeania sp. SIO2D1]|nr:hypothetical protein [Okeania sp. SIO2D1]